jgi:ribosomal 30S subunit maturation factor RimM
MEVDGSWLVPFTPAICTEVDLAARRIVVNLPEGLRELNQS